MTGWLGSMRDRWRSSRPMGGPGLGMRMRRPRARRGGTDAGHGVRAAPAVRHAEHVRWHDVRWRMPAWVRWHAGPAALWWHPGMGGAAAAAVRPTLNTESPYDATVEIYGIIYIYNPVDPVKLGYRAATIMPPRRRMRPAGPAAGSNGTESNADVVTGSAETSGGNAADRLHDAYSPGCATQRLRRRRSRRQ